MAQNISSGTLVDLKDGLTRVSGNIDLYKRLLKMFIDGNHFEALNDEIQNGDTAKAANCAHALKGICANLSFTKLRSASANLELKLKNDEEYSESLAELKIVFDSTMESVNEILNEQS